MADIIINAYDQHYANDHRHPQVIMRELGITYEVAEPQPIADQWRFYNCQNLPDELPAIVKIVKEGDNV